MMEVEEHSINEEMKKLSLEEATSELRSLKEKHERQEIILSHWKNHANDLSDRLQRIATSSDSSKSIFDVFADKGVERIIETLAIENNEMHEYFNKYNSNIIKMGAFEMSKLIKQLEEDNKHLKKVLEDHYKQIRTLTDAINCNDENVMQKKFSKQEQKLMIYKQENQKLKSYVFLQDTLMKSLKKNFDEIKHELYHIFKDLCHQYGSKLGKELEKIREKDDAKEALQNLLHPVTSVSSSKLPMGLQPKLVTEPMPGEYKPDPATDTFESGYGSMTDQDRALYEEISKTKIENNNLKSERDQWREEKIELENKIKSAKHKANEAELNLKQFLEQNSELHKKVEEKEKLINEVRYF